LSNYSYDYGTTFWKVKRGQFTCKCGKANCSFSAETIKSLHIDSDDDEIEMDENAEHSKTEKPKLSNDGSLKQDAAVEIKTENNSPHKKIKLSKNNNLFEQKDKHANVSSSKNLLVTTNNVKQNYSKETMPKNGLQLKNKSISLSVVENKEPNKNVSKQLLKIADGRSTKMLKSKLIQNKLQQVMLKKGLSENILNGNSSLAIDKKVLVTKKKSSVEAMEKTKIANGNKRSMGSVKLTSSKPVTTYVLRPKGSNKKLTENIKIENTIRNNIIKSDDTDSRATSVSSDTSISNHMTAQDSNDYDQVIDLIKTTPELVNNKSETELNVINKEFNSSKCSDTSEGVYNKVKLCETLDNKNKKHISNTEQDDQCNQLDR